MANQRKEHLVFPFFVPALVLRKTLVTNSIMVDYLTTCSKAFCNVAEADIHAFFSCTLPIIQIQPNESFIQADTLARFIRKHTFPVKMYFIKSSKASSNLIRPPQAENTLWPLISN